MYVSPIAVQSKLHKVHAIINRYIIHFNKH